MWSGDCTAAKTVAEFNDLVIEGQRSHHGDDYILNHTALRKYAVGCESARELGINQGGTLSTLIQTGVKRLFGVDRKLVNIQPYVALFELYAQDHGIDFRLFEADSSSPEATVGGWVDLLHIDSDHRPAHLRKELAIHEPLARKFIVAHDTHTKNGLQAVLESLPGWEVVEYCQKNVGYTVLKRVP